VLQDLPPSSDSFLSIDSFLNILFQLFISSRSTLLIIVHLLYFVSSLPLPFTIDLSTSVIARTFVTLSRELVTLQKPSSILAALGDSRQNVGSLFLEVTTLRGLEPLHCFYRVHDLDKRCTYSRSCCKKAY
jgi:hypothetical protein